MESELRTDAKHTSAEVQYELRKQIVRLVKKGIKNAQIAEMLGVSERHVRATKKKYEEEGIGGIMPKRRGREKGANRTLTPEQEAEIRHLIVEKAPDQLKFKECMWTRKNIQELIKRLYKINMPLSTLGYYLQRWGFSVQRPVKRARKQDEKKVTQWVEETFPGISARAKVENAEIFFGDEAGIQNTANYMRGYAPKGRTPVVLSESKHIKINMLSAVSARGKLRFMLYRDTMNADKLIDFMGRLIRESRKKVFLVLDNLRVHHSTKVSEWLLQHRDDIELFFLPPYSPEYNPDEFLNSDLKRGIGKEPYPDSDAGLEHSIRSHLKKVQLNPAKIRAFFRAKTTAYAA